MELRGGVTTEDPRLDRVPSYDERSRGFQVRDLLSALPPRRKAWHPSRAGLNQGALGACVGFSCATALNASPRRARPPLDDADGIAIYRSAQEVDEWPDDQPYEGTSVLAGMKVLMARGLISEYRWIGAGSQSPVDDVVDTLDAIGGVVLGIPWYRSMFEPLPSGRIVVDPSTGLAGYHAIFALAHRRAALASEPPRELVVVQNTWGTPWGVRWFGIGGHALIAVDDLPLLLPREVNGEGAVPIEVP